MGTRATDVEQRARELWKAPYTCIVVREDEDVFSAKVLEFPGCFAEGDSREEVHANLEEVAIAWIQDQLDKGEGIPPPQPEPEYSGRFLLRFQRSVHARAARQAAIENVSLNQFIASAVAERLSAMTAIVPIVNSKTYIANIVQIVSPTIRSVSWEKFTETSDYDYRRME